jgi:uncharacterized protein YciI
MNTSATSARSPYFFPDIGIHYSGDLNKKYAEKNYFLLKLVAPRPNFSTGMTDSEARVMREHGAYIKDFVNKGTAIIMGPVIDPNGAWGMVVVEAGSEDEVRSFITRDPTVLSNLGFRYEIYPMLRAVSRGTPGVHVTVKKTAILTWM